MATAHTNLSAFNPEEVPSGKGLKIAVVVAEWNKQITENLFQGAEEALVGLWCFKRQYSSYKRTW